MSFQTKVDAQQEKNECQPQKIKDKFIFNEPSQKAWHECKKVDRI